MHASCPASLVMLIIEDNPADVVFFREALKATALPAVLQVVTNGEDALRFLRRQPPFADAPRPDVIVLDLNLPLKNGREVLQEIRREPALQTIPAAILSTSNSESDLHSAAMGDYCLYFVKTAEFLQLQDIVRRIAAHAGATRGNP